MEIPDGFLDLVKIIIKEDKPVKMEGKCIWNNFIKFALLGNGRSEAEINFIISILKKQLEYETLLKTSGDDWSDSVNKIINERLTRIKDEETILVLKNLQSELFRITASLKGLARFFKEKDLINNIDKLNEEELVKELVESEDVSNIKYTKVILWMHSIGRGLEMAPPSRQIKEFINNDIGPYYQFYDDDKYFMNEAKELASKVNKKIKATARDVSRAIFYYRTLKGFLAQRSKEKKDFTIKKFIKFLKAKKMALEKINTMLSDIEQREKLFEEVNYFAVKN